MAFPPVFTNVWDITFPPDTQLANLLGQDLRNFRTDVMQRLSLLSGTLANRPTPEIVNATWGGAGYGLLYFSTDTSQIFQWNGAAWTNITASFLSTRLVASVNLTAQNGNVGIGSTLLYAVPVGLGGYYRAVASIQMTTLSAGGNIRPGIQWSNGTNGESYQGQQVDVTQAIESGTLSTPTTTSFLAAAGTNITYSVIINGIVGVPVYSLRIRLEYMN